MKQNKQRNHQTAAPLSDSFCAADNCSPDVYGPPPVESVDWDELNRPVLPNGPPSWDGSDSGEPEEDRFRPEENLPAPVYGPPPLPPRTLLGHFLNWLSGLFE